MCCLCFAMCFVKFAWRAVLAQVILAFHAEKCYEKSAGSAHNKLRATCAWGMSEMLHIMDSAGRFLSRSEIARFDEASDLFLMSYQALAVEALENEVCNFKFRPKLHDMCQIILKCVEVGMSPCHRNCFSDEDPMGKCARVGQHTHTGCPSPCSFCRGTSSF